MGRRLGRALRVNRARPGASGLMYSCRRPVTVHVAHVYPINAHLQPLTPQQRLTGVFEKGAPPPSTPRSCGGRGTGRRDWGR